MSETNGSNGTSYALVPFAPRGLDDALALADRLANANLVPPALRKQPSDILLVIMYGADLGLSPTQAIRGIHIIEGKPCVSADLMVALVTRHPDVCKYFKLVESNERKATFETQRAGKEPVSMTWTIEQAARAKLVTKDVWQKYPTEMLRARCKAALARAEYSDLLFGIYDPDELDATPIQASGVATFDTSPEQPRTPYTRHPVVEAAAVAPVNPSPVKNDRTGELAAAIDAASDLPALMALVAEIAALPEAAKSALRGQYIARREALEREVVAEVVAEVQGELEPATHATEPAQ